MTGIIRQLIVHSDRVVLQSLVQSSENKSKGEKEKSHITFIFTCFTTMVLWKKSWFVFEKEKEKHIPIPRTLGVLEI